MRSFFLPFALLIALAALAALVLDEGGRLEAFIAFVAALVAAVCAYIDKGRRRGGVPFSRGGSVQSGGHGGYVVPLFAAGILAARSGARHTFLAMSAAACFAALGFAAFADGLASALALYTLAGVFAGGSY